jgi:xylan 1,4-beta-xylosidase
VYYDGDGVLKYDFRLNDLRLDYLHGLGYELLLSYGGMPDCIAKTTNQKSSMSNGKTRYKGKMWNTSMPRDIKVWEDICYEYTKHIIERYGLDVVSKWSLSCFNEPDASSFFLKELSSYEQPIERCAEYCKLYDAFVRGTTRASEGIRIGGPVLAGVPLFFEAFLKHVKETRVRLDFLSIHNYGTHPSILERN